MLNPRQHRVWSVVDATITVFSGEFFLKLDHPNGGTVISLRSLWVTAILYLLVLPLRSWAQADWSTHFSWDQLGKDIAHTIPWSGAIFGPSTSRYMPASPRNGATSPVSTTRSGRLSSGDEGPKDRPRPSEPVESRIH